MCGGPLLHQQQNAICYALPLSYILIMTDHLSAANCHPLLLLQCVWAGGGRSVTECDRPEGQE
jgi:hypothetical protein